MDDIFHYQKIIVALTETDRLMKEVDQIESEIYHCLHDLIFSPLKVSGFRQINYLRDRKILSAKVSKDYEKQSLQLNI